MKRVTAIILAILMIVGMAACGAKQDAEPTSDGGIRSDVRDAMEDAHQPKEEPAPEEDVTAEDPEAEVEEPEEEAGGM